MSLHHLPASLRPREKLHKHGPEALTDTELLAILLRTGLRGKDVLQLADELLHLPHGSTDAGFDGLAGLLNANDAELARVKGLGPAKRAELQAVLELARRVLLQRMRERPLLDSPDAVRDHLRLRLGALPHEVFVLLLLDAQHRLITLEQLFRGTLTQTSVYPREVVQRALHHGAAAVVLAHNHPSGQAAPSQADVTLTQTLKAALGLVDVRVLDHLVITADHAYSMAEHGQM